MKTKKFKCCFFGCKYKSKSLIQVFRHMEGEHQLKVREDFFEEPKTEVEE